MDDICPKLLDLIAQDKNWVMKQERSHGCSSSEEQKLELRLGSPGEDYCSTLNTNMVNISRNKDDESFLSLGNLYSMPHNPNTYTKIGFFMKSIDEQNQNQRICSNFHNQTLEVGALENKPFSSLSSANTAVSNSSQSRTPAPVVGWPPIRSFRKNLASFSSSKPIPESQNEAPNKILINTPVKNCTIGLFVKINMDGVPIGRKVDLKTYGSYENLSFAVDELFRGLLAAQRDSSVDKIQNKAEKEAKRITGLLDGSGEYTLVYEDHEGDRVLVGDVPWNIFVTAVKRLRVLRSSELSAFRFGNKQGKIPA